MSLTDLTGTIGVTLLLIAFLLNLFFRVSKDGFLYLGLNVAGAVIACLASVLLVYWPFIILEATWAIVSLAGLLRLIVKGKQPQP